MLAVRKHHMVAGSPEPPAVNQTKQDPLFALVSGFVQSAAEL